MEAVGQRKDSDEEEDEEMDEDVPVQDQPQKDEAAKMEEPEEEEAAEEGEEEEEEHQEEDKVIEHTIPPPSAVKVEEPVAATLPDPEEEEEEEEHEEEEQEKEPCRKRSKAEAQQPEPSAPRVKEEILEEAGAGLGVVVPREMGAAAAADTQETLLDSEIVAADVVESWGGALPPEATFEWVSEAEDCSLEFQGAKLRLPRVIYDRLYGYQRQGVVWLWNLFQKGQGGILADEMGLGKTVQTAAFLACLKHTQQGSHFLVVAPVTLLSQWKRELETWAENTGLEVFVMHGSGPERKRALWKVVTRGGVLLTSYDLVRTSAEQICTLKAAATAAAACRKRKRTQRGCQDDDSPLEDEVEDSQLTQLSQLSQPIPAPADLKRTWDVIVVDEGHNIRNPATLAGQALRRLEATSRFLLTGTPLQNKLTDLWALMDFAQPSLLGNHPTFERCFSDPISRGSKRNATRYEVELKQMLAKELKRLTAPFFLRRVKSEVLQGAPSFPPDANPSSARSDTLIAELPSKTDVVLWLNLTPAQLELYDLCLKSDVVRRAAGGGGSKAGMEALRAIAMLKSLCNHPMLLLPKDEYADWDRRVVKAGGSGACGSGEVVPVESSQMSQTGLVEEDEGTQPAPECEHMMPRLRALVPNSVEGASLLSCKLRVLSVLLPLLQRGGHRCLIFSHSTTMLDLVQICVLRVRGLKFLRIDGNTDAKDRDLKVNKFQQPDSRYFAVCLSHQVGGIGLTITGADRVILLDPSWNPSTDAQAIDRVHRIGQTKEVVVYRLIGAGAIEDKMFRLQVFKGGLSKTYLEKEQQVRFFTSKQLKRLFESPSQSVSTQSLMAERIGNDAMEHEGLLKVVSQDIGAVDDPEALLFWQSSDVLGFSDYQRLFMFLEQADNDDVEAVEQDAKALTERLVNEKYLAGQVVEGKWKSPWREGCKENQPPPLPAGEVNAPAPLQNGE